METDITWFLRSHRLHHSLRKYTAFIRDNSFQIRVFLELHFSFLIWTHQVSPSAHLCSRSTTETYCIWVLSEMLKSQQFKFVVGRIKHEFHLGITTLFVFRLLLLVQSPLSKQMNFLLFNPEKEPKNSNWSCTNIKTTRPSKVKSFDRFSKIFSQVIFCIVSPVLSYREVAPTVEWRAIHSAPCWVGEWKEELLQWLHPFQWTKLTWIW